MHLILAFALSLASPPAPCNPGGTCPHSCGCSGGDTCRCASRPNLIVQVVFSSDVRDLAADDFETREQAEERLLKWGSWTWKLLDRPFRDAEQRKRARRIVDRHFRALAGAEAPVITTLCPRQPWTEWCFEHNEIGRAGWRRPCGAGWRLGWMKVDPLESWDRCKRSRLVRAYLGRYPADPRWPTWRPTWQLREATNSLTRDLLRAGWSEPSVRVLLAWMRWREGKWAGDPR
jgi:hypothetical protein